MQLGVNTIRFVLRESLRLQYEERMADVKSGGKKFMLPTMGNK